MVTFIVLAIEHTPTDDPTTWEWPQLIDNPAGVGVAASATCHEPDEAAALRQLTRDLDQLAVDHEPTT